MEDNKKEEERRIKRECAEYLERFKSSGDINAYAYALEGTDPRLRVYVEDVIDHPDDHNINELLQIRRYFAMLDRNRWNAKAAQKFIRFYEACKFSGLKGRQSYKLIPWQVFQFSNLFGFEREDGLRLIRDAMIFIPRKASKTTSSASLAVYDLLFGDANAQAYVGANSGDQSSICFEEIRGICQGWDPKMKYFRINRKKIECLIKGRKSLAQCLTSNANTKDGLNASLVIMDEYSQARNTRGKKGSELKNVLVSSMGVRPEPLTVTITTASDVLDGPFVEELETAKDILRGKKEDDSFFCMLFCPDVDDDIGDPHTWRKVQPMLGITVQPGYYEEYWKRAQKTSDDMLTFKTKQLNIFATDERKAWLSDAKAKQIFCKDLDPRKLQHRYDCCVAFDLSVVDDFSAVAFTWYLPQEKRFQTYVKYYFPDGQLESHSNSALYKIWAEKGFLTLIPGEKIDVQYVARDIMEMGRYLRIIRIGYDQYKAQDLVNILKSTGGEGYLTPVSQTFGAFNQPVESFEMMAYADPPKIEGDNNPINAFCAENAICEEDNLGNRKPMKRTRYMKIDGIICVLMTISLFNSLKR